MNDINIGKRIKSRRKELGISVSDLSNVTGLSKATLHRYENGEIKRIKLPTIESIALKLDVNPMWLIGKSNNKIPKGDDTRDLYAVLSHALNLIRSNRFVYKGKPVPNNLGNVLERSIDLCMNFVEDSINEK